MKRLGPIIRKEFIQMRRDRLTLGMMLMIPAIQLLLYGYAINTDVQHLRTIVYDQSRTPESRGLVEAFANTRYYDPIRAAGSLREVRAAIDSGMVKVGLVIPSDFADRLRRGERAPVQVLVDASDPMTASSALNVAQVVGQARSLQVLEASLRAAGSPRDPQPIAVETRAWYNPDLRSAHFMVPGLLGVILVMTNMTVTAMAIVRERERGTMEQLIVTPIKRHELIIGKIVPYILVGYAQMTLALLLAFWVFQVPIAGSLGLLYLLALAFIIPAQGTGILISTVAQSQQQALQMSFFVFLPNILLSGFMFPIAAMPEVVQYLTYLLPLTYFLEILRGIILKGNGLEDLWKHLLPLLAMGVVLITYSVSRFTKKLG